MNSLQRKKECAPAQRAREGVGRVYEMVAVEPETCMAPHSSCRIQFERETPLRLHCQAYYRAAETKRTLVVPLTQRGRHAQKDSPRRHARHSADHVDVARV